VDVTDVTTRILFPTAQLNNWNPFVRFGETIVTSRKQSGDHGHHHQEVMLYILEGSAIHSHPGGPVEQLAAGSVLWLTAPGDAKHAANPGKGRTSRWVSIVLELSERLPEGPAVYRSTHPARPPVGADGTIVTALVGSRAQVVSESGLECSDILFAEDGTSFVEVGHERRGIIYVVSGEGRVDDAKIDVGEAVLVEKIGGVALHGMIGFRVIFATAPT
ncbi:MAG: hypothetical protein WA549_02895, partial [Thermoplasmata archaeon]